MSSPASPLSKRILGFAGSVPFISSLTTAAIGVVVLSHAIRSTIGWAGLLAAMSCLVVAAALSLIGQRGELHWGVALPVTLLVYVSWCFISVIWSEYQWVTIGSSIYQLAIGFLAVYIAISRDLIQVVRSFGDALRIVIVGSLALEILSGVLIDAPIAFLGIRGDLALGGPIQGLMGSRNQMGIVSLVAAITFSIELVTKSVRRGVAIGSLGACGVAFLLTRSPVSTGVAIIALAASVGLVAIRRVPGPRRAVVQVGVLSGLVVLAAVAYTLRSRLTSMINAGGELAVRLDLWQQIGNLTRLNPIEGFGWIGSWRTDVLPYRALTTLNGQVPKSALNAFIDVWLQTGVVGLMIFLGFAGLALARAWLVASNRRNVAHVWPAIVLATLLGTAAAESSILVEFSWFLLVICAVKASQEMSWRTGMR